MTIHFGGSVEKLKENYGIEIGQNVSLKAISFGKSEKSMAIQVVGVKSDNTIPHVTIAVSPIGKPKDSNEISIWNSLEKEIKISGIVKEYKGYEILRFNPNGNEIKTISNHDDMENEKNAE